MLSYDLVKEKNDKKETMWHCYLVNRSYSDSDLNWPTISSDHMAKDQAWSVTFGKPASLFERSHGRVYVAYNAMSLTQIHW